MKIPAILFSLILSVSAVSAAPLGVQRQHLPAAAAVVVAPTPTPTPPQGAPVAAPETHKLTPRQHKLAVAAQVELQAAIDGQNTARDEANQAKQAAKDSDDSAKLTETRAITAEKQAAAEHKALEGCAARVAKNEAIIKQVNSYWGLGGILYGVGRLVKHLLITIIVVVVLVVGLTFASSALSVAFPALGPFLAIFSRVRGAAGGAVIQIGSDLFSKAKAALPQKLVLPAIS